MTIDEQIAECEHNIRRLSANIYDCDDCMDCSAEEVDGYWDEIHDWSLKLHDLRLPMAPGRWAEEEQ